MKITFRCTDCGKLLKARPDAVGRTRKCPVCATRVTCPEPVVAVEFLDAEIIEAEVVAAVPAPAARRGTATSAPEPAPAFNPYVDVDDDDPYPLAAPGPAATSAAEPQKPCPMCGESILASAVKCRYCGEVLDPRLKKGKSKKRRKSSGGDRSSSAGARDIGIGILCVFLGLGLTMFSFAVASDDGRGGGRYFVFYGLVIGGIVQFFRGIAGVVRGD